MNPQCYGVDVSKETLDIAGDGQVVRIANTRGAIRCYVRRLPAGSLVGMEATNTYHLTLADHCHEAGLRVYVVNPRVTRHYREILAMHGHNDQMDARALASFVQRHHPELRPYTPKPVATRRLATLLRRRSKLVGVKVQLQQSLQQIPEIRTQVQAALTRIEAIIATIERLIEQHLQGNADRARLERITGIGPIVSAALICDLQSGPFRSADAFVAFYGLDPQPNDSGRLKGRRRISKRGQRLGRTLLYNAAMTTVRTAVWKPLYQRLLSRGLSKIQAIVAIARRLARTAWSIYTHQTEFNPARLCRPLT